MIEKEILYFWAAYELAQNAANPKLARFLVKAAIQHSYTAGLVDHLSRVYEEEYAQFHNQTARSTECPEVEVDRIIGTVNEAERHISKTFAGNAFQALLKRVYRKGASAAAQTTPKNCPLPLPLYRFTKDGDC